MHCAQHGNIGIFAIVCCCVIVCKNCCFFQMHENTVVDRHILIISTSMRLQSVLIAGNNLRYFVYLTHYLMLWTCGICEL